MALHLRSLKFFWTKLTNVIPNFQERDCLIGKLNLLILLQRIKDIIKIVLSGSGHTGHCALLTFRNRASHI